MLLPVCYDAIVYVFLVFVHAIVTLYNISNVFSALLLKITSVNNQLIIYLPSQSDLFKFVVSLTVCNTVSPNSFCTRGKSYLSIKQVILINHQIHDVSILIPTFHGFRRSYHVITVSHHVFDLVGDISGAFPEHLKKNIFKQHPSLLYSYHCFIEYLLDHAPVETIPCALVVVQSAWSFNVMHTFLRSLMY